MTKKSKLDIAKAIVEKSGNTFHVVVLNALVEREWQVMVSPYYNDQASGKPREIDLIAEKAFPVSSFGHGEVGTIHIQLFIECKFINQPTVFWTHDQDRESTLSLISRSTPISRDNNYANEIHYLKRDNNRVVKLFAGQSNTATEGEQFYKALNQSLNAMVSFHSRSIMKPPRNGRYKILTVVKFPIIVCGGEDNLFTVDIETNQEPKSMEENALLEVNYAYTDISGGRRSEYFLIDVVRFDKLDDLLSEIVSDVEAMKVMYYR